MEIFLCTVLLVPTQIIMVKANEARILGNIIRTLCRLSKVKAITIRIQELQRQAFTTRSNRLTIITATIMEGFY